MKLHKVIGGILRLGPGTLVGLSDVQAARRPRILKGVSKDVYELTAAAEFKAGEVLGIDAKGASKVMRALLAELTPAEAAAHVEAVKAADKKRAEDLARDKDAAKAAAAKRAARKAA